MKANLSPDGKWKSFPQHNNLLQYVPTGMFYGRVKINGKVVRSKLDTAVFTNAKEKLRDFLDERQRKAKTTTTDTFAAARPK